VISVAAARASEFAREQGYAAAEIVNRSKTSPDGDGV